MTVYSPKFNVNDFELRGETNQYLTQDQFGASLDVQYRVPAQLDWLGQLLGWSGTNYWTAFNASVDQKRQLLTGSFGVYNGYIYPEIVEVRNWDNTVVVKNNPYIKKGQFFLLGDYEYELKEATLVGENLELYFGELTDQFYSDISTTSQLKVTAVDAIPAPFYRPFAGISADRYFLCDVKDNKITLYPSFDTAKTLPYIFNTFYAGSRYYFDLPVILIISEDHFLSPTYNFDKEVWYIDVPCNLDQINTGLSARLDYQGSFLIVSIKQWKDPSDWLDKKTIQYYLGAWGNKGGYLPFHHVFDSLSLHGFDEKQSVYLEPLEREVNFDDLLNFVYQQKSTVNEVPPPINKPVQAWWNSSNRKFLLYLDDPVNCGPWVQASYPQGLDKEDVPDLTFADITSFRTYSGEFWEGIIIEILDASGIGAIDSVLGITQTLSPPFNLKMFKPKGGVGWISLIFTFNDVSTFSSCATSLPTDAEVKIKDGTSLSSNGVGYDVSNLKFTIVDPYPVSLMKYSGNGSWYLSPPNTLKYIGNTRLYESSLNYNFPVNGEMQWDFSNPSPENRVASIFYYTGWEYNLISNEWEMVGNWFDVNTGTKGQIDSLTNLIGGSSYSDGIYNGVPLIGGSGIGAIANITVISGTITNCSVEDSGQDYEIGDILSLTPGELGGGVGFSIEINSTSPIAPPQMVDYGTILVYCEGNLIVEGQIYLTENFQFSYSIDEIYGKIQFKYSPNNYEGSVTFPRIIISDSLTSSYTHDISDLVFSGLVYHATPNVSDSETLLRIWKTTPLYCVNDVKDQTLESYPNALLADVNNGPSDPNWERYFVRLPPSYQRNGSEWQKVNLTCQNFGLWGSPTLPENMVCPERDEKPDIYEEIVVQQVRYKPSNYAYTEPYIFSTYIPDYDYEEDYENSMAIPIANQIKDGFTGGKIVEYEPLHERRVDTDSLVGKGYGNWVGDYFRISDCSFLNGHLVNDIYFDNLEEMESPIWDSSIYKLPNTCLIDGDSSKVDANHFKVNYAFFIADMSAAEEAVFDFI
jgi:hypothetical protein